jgi:hypothetical membrane protein
LENRPGSDSLKAANPRTTAGAWIWIFAFQFFVAQAVVQSAWTSPFSLAANFISDLGNTVCANYPADGGKYVCSPLHGWMNLSFSAQGIIVIAGTLLLLPLGRPGIGKIVVVVLLLLTGIGMFGVGVFTENENNEGHVYAAALQFITSNLALGIVGTTRILRSSTRVYRFTSIVLGLSGLAATALFAGGTHLGLGVGGMERVAAYTFPTWLIGSGVCLLMHSTRKLT